MRLERLFHIVSIRPGQGDYLISKNQVILTMKRILTIIFLLVVLLVLGSNLVGNSEKKKGGSAADEKNV